MSRITRLRWAMVGLLVGAWGVCPALGEKASESPSPEGIAQACGAPGTGDCLEPNGSPYCENEACCEAVCAVDPYCCLTEWDEICVSSTLDFPAECGTWAGLLSAVSRKSHGAVGEFDINLPVNAYADAGIEPRASGPTQVVLTFSRPVDDLSVQASSGSVDVILTDGAEVTVELSGAHNATCLVLAVSGSNMEMDATVRVRCLVGDARTDGVVNVLDLVNIRNVLNQPVTAGNFRMDVTADGSINILDLVTVRNNLNTTAAVCPEGEMVIITEGEFQMGDTFNEGEPDGRELPVHAVWVDAFHMDRTEVTNRQYADALNWALNQGNLIIVTSNVVYKYNSGTGYPYCDTTSSNSYSRITWDGSTFGVMAGKEHHPMVRVSWYGSVAYANWRSAMEGRTPCYDLSAWECDFNADGYRLPTEAEWERAARGGSEGRRFPWSDQDTIQHARCNYNSLSSFSYDTSPTRNYHPLWGVGAYPGTSPVGFFDGSLRYKVDFNWPGSATSYQTANAANGYGLYDVAGNVFEWCNDWYSSTYYSSSPYNNPHGPASGTDRVLRGGSWYYSADYCRVAYRLGSIPDFFGNYRGFRCAIGAE